MIPYQSCALLEVVPRRGHCELITVPELPEERRAALRTRLVALMKLMSEEYLAEKSGGAPPPPAAEQRMHLAMPVIGLTRVIGVLLVVGVGLPLARGLVERHGGTIEAYSEGPGTGSEFVVRLPLASAASTPPARPRPRPAADGPPLRILIVEDHEDACEMLRQILVAWGHDVECATDGLAGVERALATPHDVLLVDIGLPKIDGYELARRVRRALGTFLGTARSRASFKWRSRRRR